MNETKKIKSITGQVAKVIQETHDTWSLEIQVQRDQKDYQAGQFISIKPHQFKELSAFVAFLEHKKQKKEPIRAYSLASAPHEDHLLITIKQDGFYPEKDDYPPLLSNFLASPYMLGRPLELIGYSGAYVIADEITDDVDDILHITAGSGIVPNFGLLKDQLVMNKNPNIRHTLIDVNRTYEDIIYEKELGQLATKYADRFTLVHLLTQEDKIGFSTGRPTVQLIESLVSNTARCLVYACGSAHTRWEKKKAAELGISLKPKFMETIAQIVSDLNIPKDRFKHEAYG